MQKCLIRRVPWGLSHSIAKQCCVEMQGSSVATANLAGSQSPAELQVALAKVQWYGILPVPSMFRALGVCTAFLYTEELRNSVFKC